jgi:hypothetical protein
MESPKSQCGQGVNAIARLTSTIVKRIEGAIFNSKEEAERHGLQLSKEWIDSSAALSLEKKDLRYRTIR